MIHIADTKVARRYGDFFIRQIHKFEEVGLKLIKSYKCFRLIIILFGIKIPDHTAVTDKTCDIYSK